MKRKTSQVTIEKKTIVIIALIMFYLLAMFLMFLPGLTFKNDIMDFKISIFSFALSGSPKYAAGSDVLPINVATISNALIVFIFFVIILVILITIFILSLKDKLNKLIFIISISLVIVLSITSSVLIFTITKDQYMYSFNKGYAICWAKISGVELTPELLEYETQLLLKDMKDAIKAGMCICKLGAGTVVTPVLLIISSLSIGGTIYLSATDKI